MVRSHLTKREAGLSPGEELLLQGLAMLSQGLGQDSALTPGLDIGPGLRGKGPGGDLRVAPPTCCSRCS